MVSNECLPDFARPPLDEVVLGVQFSSLPAFSSVVVKDIWELFRKEFPIVVEQPPLEPSFETFGGFNTGMGSTHIRLGGPPLHTRLWFQSAEQSHLLQFQKDRFLLNWRKRPSGGDYPRFEKILDDFTQYLCRLNDFCVKHLGVPLDINQAEVAYINIIPVSAYSQIGDWLNTLSFGPIDVEYFSMNFTETVSEPQGRPYARLAHELQSVVATNGKEKAVRLNLIFRGKPFGNASNDALEFLRKGRKKIVSRFVELTTEDSHKKWERKK